jgi:hypothetical protein
MWTETTMRVQAERIEALEAECDALRNNAEQQRMVAFERAGDMAMTRKERDEARAALATMTQERDDWKHTANEETRSAERTIAELTAERDKLRAQVGSGLLLTAEVRPGKITPQRYWTSPEGRRVEVQGSGRVDRRVMLWVDESGGRKALYDIPAEAALGLAAALADSASGGVVTLKPGGMTVQPLRKWTDGTMTGQVCAEAGSVVLHLRDHIGGMVVALSIPQALCIAAAIEACAEEAAGMQGEVSE